MIEGDASGKDLEALRLGGSGDAPAARRGAQQVAPRRQLVAAQAAAEVEVVRAGNVLVEEAPDPGQAAAALLVLLVLLGRLHALAALADAGQDPRDRERRQRGARVAVADGGAARLLVLGGGGGPLLLRLEALRVDLQPRDDGRGLDLEGADVADPEGGARRAARVGGRAADVVALIDGRAVGEERERRHQAAVVLQRSEQRGLVDLVARAVEAALVEAVDVVAVGAERLRAVLEAGIGLPAADDRVLEVGRLDTGVKEISTARAAGWRPGCADRVAGDRGVE